MAQLSRVLFCLILPFPACGSDCRDAHIALCELCLPLFVTKTECFTSQLCRQRRAYSRGDLCTIRFLNMVRIICAFECFAVSREGLRRVSRCPHQMAACRTIFCGRRIERGHALLFWFVLVRRKVLVCIYHYSLYLSPSRVATTTACPLPRGTNSEWRKNKLGRDFV